MTAISNRRSARWLPSRSHFAFFRLIGFLASRNACHEAPDRGILAVNRAQNAIENYLVAIFTTVTMTWYLTLALERLLVVPAAALIALFFAPVAVQLPLYLTGGVLVPLWRKMTGRGDANNLHLSSFVLMTTFFALAAFFVTRAGWTRVLAIAWLAVGFLNALAAIAMFFLRNRVRELESRCGA